MHDFKNYPELTNSQMSFYYFDSPHQQIAEDFNARVVKVTDGDTIRVTCDFRDFDFPIRISNILAAELNEEGGIASQRFLYEQIIGEDVDIIVNPHNRVEKWGRLLGQVKHLGMDMGELSKSLGFSIGIQEERGDIPTLLQLLN